MTPSPGDSVANAGNLLASLLQIAPGEPGTSEEHGDQLGLDATGAVPAENLPPAPAWAAQTATRATERVLGEDCSADRRAAIADSVRRVTELYTIAFLEELLSGAPPHSPDLPAGLFEIVSDAARKNVHLYYLLRAMRIAHLDVVEYVATASGHAGDRRDGHAGLGGDRSHRRCNTRVFHRTSLAGLDTAILVRCAVEQIRFNVVTFRFIRTDTP